MKNIANKYTVIKSISKTQLSEVFKVENLNGNTLALPLHDYPGLPKKMYITTCTGLPGTTKNSFPRQVIHLSGDT